MKSRIALVVALVAGLGLAALGCKKEASAPAGSKAIEPVKGERHSSVGFIRQFGDQHKTIVLEHQTFPDGFMMGMTMSFELKDPKLAEGFKIGDKVSFTLEGTGNSFPVVELTKVK